jgi:hypothetical protein
MAPVEADIHFQPLYSCFPQLVPKEGKPEKMLLKYELEKLFRIMD